jgi:hypothetical protein
MTQLAKAIVEIERVRNLIFNLICRSNGAILPTHLTSNDDCAEAEVDPTSPAVAVNTMATNSSLGVEFGLFEKEKAARS